MILIPVWSQLRISSRGISSISTVATTSAKNRSFRSWNFATACLLLAVVTFLWTKFIQCSSENARSTLSSMCPRYSASIDLFQVRRRPLAAATTILAETTPPPSLTFFKYTCTFISNSSPKRTRLPLFFGGSSAMSPSSPTTRLSLFFKVSPFYWMTVDLFTLYSVIQVAQKITGCLSNTVVTCVAPYLSTDAWAVSTCIKEELEYCFFLSVLNLSLFTYTIYA